MNRTLKIFVANSNVKAKFQWKQFIVLYYKKQGFLSVRVRTLVKFLICPDPCFKHMKSVSERPIFIKINLTFSLFYPSGLIEVVGLLLRRATE
ncbi:hypothetical protein BpHYR1_052631 [Brachionus plicatilis]|uniref:Uncharacterized protein n=1 Tax=Brachionus plicatilis TaxID=10195 RepID=A0A3M7Q378_BRAPC|nr:hypothetical protein BpHYR1_052631 [Brachionus plicatilis]